MTQRMSLRGKCALTCIFCNHEKLCQPVVRSSAERILPQRFWSSDKLTGSQTPEFYANRYKEFWSSDKLTGSQTLAHVLSPVNGFGAVANWLVVKQAADALVVCAGISTVTNRLLVKLILGA